jgi:HTH-type transcriptional regulator / antitoxin HigA
MEVHTIKTEKEYQLALEKIDALLLAPQTEENTEQLEIISILVEDYEAKNYKIEAPEPIAAIKFRMEQLGLSRKDLEQSIGSRGRVAEIFNGKRNLTLAMIRKLHKNLNIPADILIRETKKKSA